VVCHDPSEGSQTTGGESFDASATGTMRACQEMIYGGGRGDLAVKGAWRDLLLQYCKLDTLATVIIWAHWTS